MLLAFIMIPLIQRELNTFKDTVWNSHRIRPQKDATLPAGIPEHIYSFPHEYGLEECGKIDCKPGVHGNGMSIWGTVLY